MSLQEVGDRDMVIRAAPRKEHHPARRILPNRRKGHTYQRRIGGSNVFVMVCYFDDGAPAEVWISTAHISTSMRTLLSAFAQTISVALQCGTPLSELDTSLENLQDPSEQGFDPSLVIAFAFDCLNGKITE